jgi:hypothetical protein
VSLASQEAEDRAAELLRAWLAPDQRAQLAAFGAFAVCVEGDWDVAVGSLVRGPELFALVPGTLMVYYPARQLSYMWYPRGAASLPPSDQLLCQALALSAPGGSRAMRAQGCKWARGLTLHENVSSNGFAWLAVDRLTREVRQ